MSMQVMGTAHCATDPVLKTLNNGKLKADVPVYINDVWIDRVTGARHESAHHFHCVFWGSNAERAEKLLMKGSQLIITSAQLRTSKDVTKKITYTQIWVEKWEVPTKVMLSKSVYQEIFHSELMPYKVCVWKLANTVFRVEVNIDKYVMGNKNKDYFQQPVEIQVQFKQDENTLLHTVFSSVHRTFANTFCDRYQIDVAMDGDWTSLNRIHTQLFINKAIAFENMFPFKECLQQQEINHE